MKHKITLMIIVVILIFSICSCSPNNDISSGNMEKKTMLDDIKGVEGIYCLHSDGTITKPELISERWTEEYVYSHAEPLIIDRTAGDKLIYIGDMVYFGTYNDGIFEMDYKCDKYYWSGKTVDFFDIEEFEGADIKGKYTNHTFLKFDTEEEFSTMGFVVEPKIINAYDGEVFILSYYERSYTYGFFEGTDWKEKEERNDVPFYDLISNGTNECAFEAPVIKGKDGYFTIDVTDVEAGIYYHDFDSGEFDEYIIEIR